MKKNKFGFSLVEILISVTLLGALALAGMQIIKSQSKSLNKSQFDSEVALLTNQINAILGDPAKCIATFGPPNTVSALNGTIQHVASTFYVKTHASAPATGYGNMGIFISQMNLNSDLTKIGQKQSTLVLTFDRKEMLKTSASNPTLKTTVELYVETDAATKNITACRSLAQKNDIWSRGNGTHIYYNGGNVSIGSSTTANTALEVNGPIKFGDQTTAPASCSSQIEGSQRYNKSTKQMEYCTTADNVNFFWKNISGNHIETRQGFVNICGCGAHVCCYNFNYSTPFNVQTLGLTITLASVTTGGNDTWGHSRLATTTHFQNVTRSGATACFDHIDYDMFNCGQFSFIAVGE